MTKSEAKELFGTVRNICKVLGVQTQSYYRWPDELTQARSDQLVGAYLRLAEERDRQVIHKYGKIG